MSPVRQHILAGLALGVSGGIMFFILAGAFYAMSKIIEGGDYDFKDVMVAFMGIFFAAMGAGQAASMMGDASKATVAAHDAFELLDRQSLINGMHSLGPTPTDTSRDGFQPGKITFK